MTDSLWGEEFSVAPKPTKKIIDKINNPKKVSETKSVTKKVQSRKVSVEEKLSLVYSEVDRILGHYKENTTVIRDIDTFRSYINKSIQNGVISIDTETNNSLDPISCKIMGLCLYTPGEKNAYIPVNHINRLTGNKLDNQLTEQDINEELSKVKTLEVVMHNGKFDYQVLKCTCGIEIPCTWDTMIAARILDENELRANLKLQYIDKIDNSQEKYSIDHLFEGLEYAIVDPEVFALYAATDSFMTYKLYKWQQEQFNLPENQSLTYVFKHVEMPVIQVAAEMELTGIEIDVPYAERLSKKYHKLLEEVDNKIDSQLQSYKETINNWRLTAEANEHAVKNGKVQKSKSEQLRDPVEVNSPTQLAILLYDVLKVPTVDTKSPRGTGEDILLKIDNPICKLVLERRGLEKLINTYIDKIPACVSSVDHRLHAHFNQLGAGTGRFSSSDPNLQNIPSHSKNIRLMFKAGYRETFVDNVDNVFQLYAEDEILSNGNWVPVKQVRKGDFIDSEGTSQLIVDSILPYGEYIILTCC